jgi:signal peptidase II
MNKYFVFIIASAVLLIDQVSKYLVMSKLYFAQSISVISNIFSLTKIFNTGAAFSILENNTAFLVVFSALASIVIIIYILRKSNLQTLYIISWGLILGGTLGNLTDRVLYGFVIDFIKLDFINFPVFNISDTAINIGAFIIIVCSIVKIFKGTSHEQAK